MENIAYFYPDEIADLLLNTAIVAPVMIWGQPGIGKSAVINQFGEALGMEVVSLLGSTLAPEDVQGAAKIVDLNDLEESDSVITTSGVKKVPRLVTRFFPPSLIYREVPFILFLDEINGCSFEVQKAFYSLVLDQKAGDYELPKGSIVIAAGNRAQDSAIVKKMSSALIGRFTHFGMKVSAPAWLNWAGQQDTNPLVLEFIRQFPRMLVSDPPKVEEPYSTPRSWTRLSAGMNSYPEEFLRSKAGEKVLDGMARGNLSPDHAVRFCTFVRNSDRMSILPQILRGEVSWPDPVKEPGLLLFLAETLRNRLVKELPPDRAKLSGEAKELVVNSKSAIARLARVSNETAQLILAKDDDEREIPDWLTVELGVEIPRLSKSRG